MGLDTPCGDYEKHSRSWIRTRDVAEGSLCIKGKGTTYLPKGRMDENAYTDYLERAIFVGYVDKIIDYCVGQLMRNAPTTTGIPDDLINDVDLCGSTLSQFIDNMARELMAVERIGVWVDFNEKKDRPFMVSVKAESIIKWHYDYTQSGEKALTSVVIKTSQDTIDKETLDIVVKPQYIKLFLNDNGIYQKDTYECDDKKELTLKESIIPVAGIGGLPLTYIPFRIVCAKGTPERIHTAPMAPVAEINLSLYRSMASREQLLFYYGMPTGIAVGWDDKNAFPLGGVAAFPIGGSFDFAQIQVEDAVEKAIQSKKEEISQIGSQFLSGRGRYVASATTSENNQEGENASLATLANSISRGVTEAFKMMEVYEYDDLEEPSVQVNTEFVEPELTQGELQELGVELTAGHISFDTYFHNLNRNKVYPPGWTVEKEIEALKTSARIIAENRSEIPGVTY